MNVKYVDAHCHLQFEQYEHDREEIIARMREESVVAIVVGCDFESSKQAVALAEKHEHIYAAVGLHPDHGDEKIFDTARYRELAQHPKVVAIGECGLEYFHSELNDEGKGVQKENFQKQIELAAELDKPIIIHARATKGTQDAYDDSLTIIREAKKKYPNLRGDAHFFASDLARAEQFIALGFTISFTAVITFARDYDSIIRAAPITNILAETDAPFVAPASRRGQRNDPLAVIEVVNQIAQIRGEDIEEVRTALLSNTVNLFALQGA